MLETKASRSRPASPAAAAWACCGSASARGQQALHLGQQRRAGRAQRHAALRALEQPRAQRALQLLDGLRQRRLGHVQALRGAAEVQFFGQHGKLAQRPEFDH